jgi:hypothetical protein
MAIAADLALDLACSLDPVILAEQAGITPDPWQCDVLRCSAARMLLLCSRQAGKSTITSILAVHTALYEPGSLVLLLSPTLRQSGELFKKCAGVYQALGRPVPSDSESALQLELEIFRMSMYHVNHPDGNYQMANRVQVFDPPSTISWEPGYDAGDGTLRFGGWTWRYDLTPAGPSNTTVTLSYDWSAVPDSIREHIGFPPFPPEHLANSLAHLAELVTL